MAINERAKEFAKEMQGCNSYLVAHAYHCGATDQLNIDIEKACELYKEEIKQMKCLLNHFSKGAGELIDLERSLEIFKQGLTNP